MSSWHSYPKIYALGHIAIKSLFDNPVIIQEKVDGSQISFGRFGDELRIKSKNAMINLDYPEGLFEKAVEEIKKRFDLLKDGWTYRGEYLKKPKHHTIKYDRVPKGNIILFDINDDEESYLQPELVIKEADNIGFESVLFIYGGMINNSDRLKEYLKMTSILGGSKIEGIVIKNYHIFGPDKKVLMGKYVSEEFKESSKVSWKNQNPNTKDIVQNIIEVYKVEARWNKAVQHLKESGNYEGSPRDIGNIMKEIHKDLDEECKEEIAKIFLKYFMPQIKRGVCGGVPEWYKNKLMEEQFDE